MKQKVSTNVGKGLEQVFDIKWGNKGRYYMSRKTNDKGDCKACFVSGQ